MKQLSIFCAVLLAVFALAAPAAAFTADDVSGEMDGDCVYTLYAEDGTLLTMRAARMYEDDEYIAGDDKHYRITRVDDDACEAYAAYIGMAYESAGAWEDEAAHAEDENVTRRIGMYSTHSDESYVEGDGESSKLENAGIYDVGNALKESLEQKGVDVDYSEETFHPHDAGAYSRSRSTAEDLIKQSPDALFDVHRDAIPASHYETEVDGEEISKVRLFVGRRNPNSESNMAFAKQIKRAADEMHPGLIKDIYIGKGNYNQELYPRALLLEMGTHVIDKELVLKSTDYLADVVDRVLYGETAQAAERDEVGQESNAGAWKGILWVVGIAVVAALVYAFVSTGSGRGMWDKFKRSASELTGGSVGKRNRK